MKTSALQGLVKKIFSDEETKSQFASDPGKVISRFALTEPEKKAVLNMHSLLGVASADSPQVAAAIEPMFSWV